MTDDPLQPHAHENNTIIPGNDPTIALFLPNGMRHLLTPETLHSLPQTTLPRHLIVTDHGAHGPYRLSGVALVDLVHAYWQHPFDNVAVLSADGYGNRVLAAELENSTQVEPILLVLTADGEPLTREHGFVRLIVPSETDNALRQIKWVSQVQINAIA